MCNTMSGAKYEDVVELTLCEVRTWQSQRITQR